MEWSHQIVKQITCKTDSISELLLLQTNSRKDSSSQSTSTAQSTDDEGDHFPSPYAP